MKRFDFRIIIGLLLVVGGILALLDQTGFLKGATSFFWAGIFAVGAVVFLFWFFTDHSKWWAAIPGFALAGLAVSSLVPDNAGWDGLAFLGSLGVGFWAVYLARRRQWWAIIPGGVLITLGVVSVLSYQYPAGQTSGVFLAGLGITFILVALLAKMRWAFIPAAVLFLLGFFVGAPFAGGFEYVWIGLLVLAGLILILSALRK